MRDKRCALIAHRTANIIGRDFNDVLCTHIAQRIDRRQHEESSIIHSRDYVDIYSTVIS